MVIETIIVSFAINFCSRRNEHCGAICFEIFSDDKLFIFITDLICGSFIE